MTWFYLPVCIRLVSKRKDKESQGFSGIFFFSNGPSTSSNSHFCLSVCHIPLRELDQDYDIFISAKPLMKNNQVVWIPGLRGKSAPVLSLHNDPVYDYIHYALKNGFNFIPSDTLVGNHLLSSLNFITIHCKALQNDISSDHFRKFSVGQPSELSSFHLTSFPFTFTSPSMFAEFVSTGSVNSIIRDSHGNLCGLLSDVKYLENMAGGIMSSKNGSFGMLLGNLRKLNGDGDLLMVLPWERIINSALLDKSMLSNPAPPPHTRKAVSPKLSILSLVLCNALGESFSWGSCVLLNKSTLVTNAHVMQTFHDSRAVKCRVITNQGLTFNLSHDDDKLIVPFKNLDVAFIVLSSDNQNALSHLNPVSVGLSYPHNISEEVVTIGHGLLLNELKPNPIVSSGTISSKLSMNPFKHHYPEIPCLMVASSRCWNGSSGGGVFNKHGQFIGLICSNAQVFLPAVSGDQVAPKTEKVSLFCLCIPIELIFECYRVKVVEKSSVHLNDKLIKSWNLENCNHDIYERRNKL